MTVRDPGACRDCGENTGSIGDGSRDRCATGRAHDTETDEDETRGGGRYEEAMASPRGIHSYKAAWPSAR
ncbi:MAG: hypothetical protein C5S48_09980 [Candidatus Methanogaster sp.]|nr:MAG: hypothetical protein C5S48_09980 [ANME-2 cluster archaeon]